MMDLSNLHREKTDSAPLAIVGYSVRYPQDADNADRFWNFLLQARESSSPFPEDRINAKGFYHPDPNHGGTFHARRAHFLKESPVAFDAAFFKMSKTEVLSLDPQHRLVMENVYHALENAGIPLEKAVSSNTSVFVNGYNHDHADNLKTDPETILKYKPTGTENSLISGRLSWFYDFHGPSMTIETACSGSLVGLHLACQSLKLQESDTAIVSGVNVIGFLPHMLGMSYSGFVGSEGKCLAFDERADGYARGEGVGTIIIKPLATALQDGDVIRAVIRGTGLNQDGKTPGVTYPSMIAQDQLICKTYSKSGLDPADTCYIESHGTGTQAGDVVEVSAIARAFDAASRKLPLYIGALKTNIGHLEGGSGIAGLIKTIMILESGIIPPNANFENLNPKISLQDRNLSFPTESLPWPTPGVRRASVSCFGLSGTNSHCILDDAYNFLNENGLHGRHNTRVDVPTSDEIKAMVLTRDSWLTEQPSATKSHVANLKKCVGASTPASCGTPRPKILVLSAFNEKALERYASHIVTYLQRREISSDDDAGLLSSLAFTLSNRRTHFPWTTSIIANSTIEVQQTLTKGELRISHRQGSPKLGFVFTGQGAQYIGMGQQLITYTEFRTSLEQASRHFQTLGSDWLLLDELTKKHDTRINIPAIAHPALTAIQIALVDLLHGWNVTPLRVVGHSSGEIAAAYCAGKISRESAWRVAFFRGQMVSENIKAHGSMMAVALSPADLEQYLEKVRKEGPSDGVLVIACFNSPKNQTVSGDEVMIDTLKQLLDAEGIFARKLNVSNAYHSSHMTPFVESYHRSMGSLEPGDSHQNIRMFSTFTGAEILDPFLDASYWCANMVGSVKFTDALQALCFTATHQDNVHNIETGRRAAVNELIEIGAHSALSSAVKETIAEEHGISYSPSLVRNSSGPQTLLHTIGTLSAKGCPADISKANGTDSPDKPAILVDLPPYPFDHSNEEIYESRLARNLRLRPHPRHDLFGAPVSDWNPRHPRWRHFLRVGENPWLKQHMSDGRVIFPDAGYLVMAIESSMQMAEKLRPVAGLNLTHIDFISPLIIPDTAFGVEVMIYHTPADETGTWKRFEVSSYSELEDHWILHCSGLVCLRYEESYGQNGSLPVYSSDRESVYRQTQWKDASYHFNGVDKIYKGIDLGPIFRTLSNVRIGGGSLLADVRVPDIEPLMPQSYMHSHLLHPVTLHSIMQAAATAAHSLQDDDTPFKASFRSIEAVWISANVPSEPETILQCFAQASAFRKEVANCDIDVLATSVPEEYSISISGLQLKPREQTSDRQTENELQIYSIEWFPDISLLTKAKFDHLVKPPASVTTYDEESSRFTNLQLASALLATDALIDLKGLDLSTVAPHYHHFYDLLKHIAADILTDSIPSIPFKTWQEYAQDESRRDRLYDEVAAQGTDGALLMRVGRQLASFFRNKVDPLYIMFGQNDDLMTQYYDEDFQIGRIPQGLETILSLIRWSNRPNLRVLEVGAGTGSFTAQVLSRLCPPGMKPSVVAEYIFTDLSSGFFEKARERLEPWSDIMSYNKFDVGVDPGSQGFLQGTYDLVIASNVLHATPDLHKTLMNLRSLLRSGGRLLLHEGIRQDAMWTNLSFSALPGWWLSMEPERRWCPYIPAETWDRYLQECGFSGVDFETPSSDYAEFAKLSLMVSTAKEPKFEEDQRKDVIICVQEGEVSKIAEAVMSRMHNLGIKCLICPLNDLRELDLSNKVLISMLEVEAALKMDEDEYHIIQRVFAICQRTLWVTGSPIVDPTLNVATGITRSMRQKKDSNEMNLVTLSIADKSLPVDDMVNSIFQIFSHQFLSSRPVADRNAEYNMDAEGIINTNRIVVNSDASSTIRGRLSMLLPVEVGWEKGAAKGSLKMRFGQPGDLESITWVTDRLDKDLAVNDVEIYVRAVGLSSLDVRAAKVATAQLTLGGEATGVVTKVGSGVSTLRLGDRVICLDGSSPYPAGTLRTHFQVDSSLAMQIPETLEFEAAAALPVTWTTVIYALKHIGQLTIGERVLVSAAASAIGQAAIQYSQYLQAEVFAVVSSTDERETIMREYEIPEDHIFLNGQHNNSAFSRRMKRLAPMGMDVILNVEFDEQVTRDCWNCIASCGRFVEVGNNPLAGTAPTHSAAPDNVTLSKVDIITLARRRPQVAQQLLQDVIHLWSEDKIRAAQPTQVLSYGQLGEAIQLLQGNNVHHLVLRPGGDQINVVPETAEPTNLDPHASYVFAGGLGEINRKIAVHLVDRGARQLIFLYQKCAKIDSQDWESFSEALAETDCKAVLHRCDISVESELDSFISRYASHHPPIKGYIKYSAPESSNNGDLVSSGEESTTALHTRAKGYAKVTNLLHKPDFFIMISSTAGINGTGSSRYAAETAFHDALAQQLVSHGVHATSIHSHGLSASTDLPTSDLKELLAMIDYATDPSSPQSPQLIGTIPTPASCHDQDDPTPPYLSDPLFRRLPVAFSPGASSSSEPTEQKASVRDALRGTGNAEQAALIVSDGIRRKLSSLLNVAESEIDFDNNVRINGVDSLIQMEFLAWLDSELSTEVSAEELGSKSIRELSGHLVSMSPLVEFG